MLCAERFELRKRCFGQITLHGGIAFALKDAAAGKPNRIGTAPPLDTIGADPAGHRQKGRVEMEGKKQQFRGGDV